MIRLRRRWKHKGWVHDVCPWNWAALRGNAPGWTIWNVTAIEHSPE